MFKIDQVYVDMDGPLTDFFGASADLFDKDMDEYPKGNYSPFEFLGVNEEEYWQLVEKIGAKFWLDMKPAAYGSNIWQAVKSLNPIVLTSPAKHCSSSEGKVLWLQNEFGEDFRDYILCPSQHKQRLSRPGVMLIDDSELNIKQWRARGGLGFLWPCYGNSLDTSEVTALETLNYIVAASK